MAYFDLSGGGGSTPPTGKYTATTRDANIDMGANSNNRYLDTTGVPNTNSGTYTFPANDTGGTKDLGETNTIRYVNASNVYAKGKADKSLGWGPSSIRFYHAINSATLSVVLVWTALSGGKISTNLEIYNDSIPTDGNGKSYSRSYGSGTANYSIYAAGGGKTNFTLTGKRSSGETASVTWSVNVTNPSFAYDTRNYISY